MCETCNRAHPLADAALGKTDHDHEDAAEAQLDAAASSEEPVDREMALRLAEVEAQLALARNVGRIAAVMEEHLDDVRRWDKES